jgi:polyisoprenoid-binding protein YceI
MTRAFSGFVAAAFCALALPAFAADMPAMAVTPNPQAGAYALDKTHGSLLFRVNHLGFSHYTARFTRFDAQLQFDPAKPEAMHVSATVDPTSIQTDYPLPKPNFDKDLQSKSWLDTAAFPKMTFESTSVQKTGANTARVTGNLTLHGVTHPVSLDVTYNGGYAAMNMDPAGSRIGFSARGTLKRSDFGVSFGIPAPGTMLGVGNDVEVIIEAEFIKPLPKPGKP